MKICADCKYSKKEFVQMTPNQMGAILVCTNMECRDPVEGGPIPCNVARSQPAFCGLPAKYHEPKPEDAAVLAPAPAEGSVIQVAK